MAAGPTPDARASATTLALDAEMTIVNAAAQHEQLLAAVQAAERAGGGLLLDMAAVDGVDSAGLQLLLAARHSLRRTQAALALQGARPVVAEAAGVYGLASELCGTAAVPT